MSKGLWTGPSLCKFCHHLERGVVRLTLWRRRDSGTFLPNCSKPGSGQRSQYLTSAYHVGDWNPDPRHQNKHQVKKRLFCCCCWWWCHLDVLDYLLHTNIGEWEVIRFYGLQTYFRSPNPQSFTMGQYWGTGPSQRWLNSDESIRVGPDPTWLRQAVFTDTLETEISLQSLTTTHYAFTSLQT